MKLYANCTALLISLFAATETGVKDSMKSEKDYISEEPITRLLEYGLHEGGEE